MGSKTSEIGKDEKILVVPLSDILVNSAWNARGGVERTGALDSEETPEMVSTAWADFRASIAEGQDTACVVRPNRTPGSKQPYELACGFRRVEAIRQNYEEAVKGNPNANPPVIGDPKTPPPTVKVVVRHLTSTEFRALNLRENTARKNLNAFDLVYGLADMRRQAKAAGDPTSSVALSKALGMNQPYVNKLIAIGDGLRPAALTLLRSGTIKATTDQAKEIVEKHTTEEAQIQAIQALNADEGPKTLGDWLKKAKEAADENGHTLGTIARRGGLELSLEPQEFAEEHLRTLMTFKQSGKKSGDGDKKVTDGQVAQVFKAFAKGYERALSETDEEDEGEVEDDIDRETGEVKGKKKSAKGVKGNGKAAHA